MARWRVLLHALDRTGPPRLAQALIERLRVDFPDDVFDIVSLRGGALLDEFRAYGDVRVALVDFQPMPCAADIAEVAAARSSVGDLGPCDATLLVSVSSAPLLWICDIDGPLVTWVVEIEADYDPVLLASSTRWIAGSADTRLDVIRRLDAARPDRPTPAVEVVREFIGRPRVERSRSEVLATMGMDESSFVVMAAGIGTERKAPDLFLEAALRLQRIAPDLRAQFVWVGGERDDLLPEVERVASERGVSNLRFVSEVDNVAEYMAAANVFLHVARQDAFPLVCLTAAAVGTPVVAFAGVGGVPEMMGNAFVGSPYPDLGGLVDAVAELSDWGRRQIVGRAQQQRVTTHYMAELAAAAVRNVLVEAAT